MRAFLRGSGSFRNFQYSLRGSREVAGCFERRLKSSWVYQGVSGLRDIQKTSGAFLGIQRISVELSECFTGFKEFSGEVLGNIRRIWGISSSFRRFQNLSEAFLGVSGEFAWVLGTFQWQSLRESRGLTFERHIKRSRWKLQKISGAFRCVFRALKELRMVSEMLQRNQGFTEAFLRNSEDF